MNLEPNLSWTLVIIMIGWLVACSLIFYNAFGSWWAIPVGALIGAVTCGIFAPQRWRKEYILEGSDQDL